MKNHKNLLMSITAGILSCSFCMTVSAGAFSDADILKRGLLLELSDKLTDYNTNQDDKVNVLDLCRIKREAIEKNMPKKQYVSLNAVAPWVSTDKSTVTVPVKIKGNKLGVSSVSFTVEYNTWYFELTEVYTSAKDSVSFSKNNDRVQYTAGNNENNTIEGYLIYLVFEASPEVPLEKHTIELTDIEYAMIDNGSARELQSDECSSNAKVSFEYSRSDASQNPVTEPIVSTTAKTTTTVKTTTTSRSTTIAETTKTTTASTSPAAEKSEILNFRLDNAELSSDSKSLRIPVYMDMNTGKVGSINTTVKYDTGKFKLVGVERGDFDGYGYVGGNSDNAVFAMNNAQNISQRSGIIAYLKFEVNGGADSKTYGFELSDIKLSYYENWNSVQIDKFRTSSDAYRYSFANAVTTAPVTTVTDGNSVVTTVSKITENTKVTEITPNSGTEVNYANAEAIEKEALDLIQQWRRELNLPEFTPDEILFECADIRAAELQVSYSATRPDGSKRKDLLVQKNAPNASSSSEFYCRGYNNADSMLVQFKKIVSQSPGNSVENGKFKYIGIGYDNGYWSVILT